MRLPIVLWCKHAERLPHTKFCPPAITRLLSPTTGASRFHEPRSSGRFQLAKHFALVAGTFQRLTAPSVRQSAANSFTAANRGRAGWMRICDSAWGRWTPEAPTGRLGAATKARGMGRQERRATIQSALDAAKRVYVRFEIEQYRTSECKVVAVRPTRNEDFRDAESGAPCPAPAQLRGVHRTRSKPCRAHATGLASRQDHGTERMGAFRRPRFQTAPHLSLVLVLKHAQRWQRESRRKVRDVTR